jgi:hypothetical protein
MSQQTEQPVIDNNPMNAAWQVDGSIVYLKHPMEDTRLFEINVITAFQSKNLAERMKFANDFAGLLTWVDSKLMQDEVEAIQAEKTNE